MVCPLFSTSCWLSGERGFLASSHPTGRVAPPLEGLVLSSDQDRSWEVGTPSEQKSSEHLSQPKW